MTLELTRDTARLIEDGDGTHCTEDPLGSRIEAARARGERFWALGHDPDWTLAVGTDRMRLVTDYGSTRVTAVTPGGGAAGPGRRWATEAFTVRARPSGCTDPESGRRFAHEVVVEFRGRRLVGCGLALR